MELPLAELIDRMSIVKLKIERIGEAHLQEEFEEYEKALKEMEDKGVQIKPEWFDKLYEFNGKIWDQEFIVRQIADKVMRNENSKEEIDDSQLEEIGSKYIVVGDLMRDRVKVKNKITEESGQGFKEVKIDHCAE